LWSVCFTICFVTEKLSFLKYQSSCYLFFKRKDYYNFIIVFNRFVIFHLLETLEEKFWHIHNLFLHAFHYTLKPVVLRNTVVLYLSFYLQNILCRMQNIYEPWKFALTDVVCLIIIFFLWCYGKWFISLYKEFRYLYTFIQHLNSLWMLWFLLFVYIRNCKIVDMFIKLIYFSSPIEFSWVVYGTLWSFKVRFK